MHRDSMKFRKDSGIIHTKPAIDAMMERMKNDVFIVSIDDWLKLNTNGKSIYTQLRLTPGSRFYRVRAVNEENASIQSNPDELFLYSII